MLEDFDSWFYEGAGRGRGRIRASAPCPLRHTFDMVTLQVRRRAAAPVRLPLLFSARLCAGPLVISLRPACASGAAPLDCHAIHARTHLQHTQSGPEGYAMLQQLKELSLKEGKANSLKGLMETVIAGARAEQR